MDVAREKPVHGSEVGAEGRSSTELEWPEMQVGEVKFSRVEEASSKGYGPVQAKSKVGLFKGKSKVRVKVEKGIGLKVRQGREGRCLG